MHLPLLQDLLIILGFSAVIVFLLQRFKIPSILGFLVTGLIIGPYGLSLIHAVEQVETISEIGVILLLFVIGMELSIKQLASIRKTVFIGGASQVFGTAFITGGIYYLFGNPWNESLFIGFLFSLSSTAVVLKVLQDRNEISRPHGRNALGILIFQDIIVVPMMLVTPIIAGNTANVTESIIGLLIKSAIVIAITIISARYIVPRLMHAVARTRSKELFLITTITLCFAIAFLTSEAGLSLALGAFLAGLIISESEYSHQATSIVLPFRELFTSFFFISVGMLLDLSFLIENIFMVSALVLAVFVLKSIIAGLAVAQLKYPPKTVILTGLSLFQVGEFAFILSVVGLENGLLDEQTNQFFLAVSIVSMLTTPFVMMFSNTFAHRVAGSFIGKAMEGDEIRVENDVPTAELSNHLVIIGYGINGRNLARAAEYSHIPYAVIELNAQTVIDEKAKGIPILFGDASNEHILETVNLRKARAVVVAISDSHATKNIIANIRSISSSVYTLVRTRYVRETEELLHLGADDVIPEEFETSIEIFSRVLHSFLIPIDEIETITESVRSDNYELFKAKKELPRTLKPTRIPDFNVTCVRVAADSGVVGKRIIDTNIRSNFGVSILAISRNDDILYGITPEEKILQNDLIFFHGDPASVSKFQEAVT